MTSFFIWYDALKPCPCLYQIWSKSVEKHGHSGPKTARNGPKWTFLHHNVATSLRHDVFFHMLRCAYTMSMSVLNLNQIGWKTRPQWPKNPQNGPKWTFLRHNVTTSLRHQNFYPLTPRAMVIPIMCPNMKKIGWETKKFKQLQIWSLGGGGGGGHQMANHLTYSRPKWRAQKKFWLVKHEKNPAWDCPNQRSSESERHYFLC